MAKRRLNNSECQLVRKRQKKFEDKKQEEQRCRQLISGINESVDENKYVPEACEVIGNLAVICQNLALGFFNELREKRLQPAKNLALEFNGNLYCKNTEDMVIRLKGISLSIAYEDVETRNIDVGKASFGQVKESEFKAIVDTFENVDEITYEDQCPHSDDVWIYNCLCRATAKLQILTKKALARLRPTENGLEDFMVEVYGDPPIRDLNDDFSFNEQCYFS